MNQLSQSATYTDSLGNQVEDMMFTYSEEEREENIIAKENAKRLFQPKFIPFYPGLQRKFDLTDAETKLYGFIHFYSSGGAGRFYFTNKQLSEVLNAGVATVTRSIKRLSDLGLVNSSIKQLSAGKSIRYIDVTPNQNDDTPPNQFDYPPSSKRLANNNNKKNISNINITNKQNVRYGNIFVNEIGDRFVKLTGQNPIESNWRFLAYALTRKIKSTLKDNGKTVTDDLVLAGIGSYFEWLDNQSWSIKKMRTVNEHFETFKAEAINETARRREYGK